MEKVSQKSFLARIFVTVFAFTFLLSTVIVNLSASLTIFAQQRNPVRICHGTAAHPNPYTSNTVDEDAVDGDTGNDNGQGDHYSQHTGPVWYDGITVAWGDIIPPVAGHSGRNWNANGQGIWNNNCNIPSNSTSSPSPSPLGSSPSPTPGSILSATPTPISTATPGTADICANIDGIQTTVPNDYHLDASGLNCVQFQLGGPSSSGGGSTTGQVLGAATTSESKGRVLGVSTLANAGNSEHIFNLIFLLGFVSATFGVRQYVYAKKETK